MINSAGISKDGGTERTRGHPSRRAQSALLRACEAMTLCTAGRQASRGEVGVVTRLSGKVWQRVLVEQRLCGRLSGRCQESVAGQDVVSQREPMQHRAHFLASPNGELVEAPLS